MMHVAEDGEDLVLSPWCSGEETPSGKVIPPGETNEEETQKPGKNRDYACGKRQTD